MQTLLHDQSGPELVEWVVVIIILLVSVVVLLTALVTRPDLAQLSPLIAIFSAAIGGLAWSVKQAISTLHNRAQLLILETLSDGVPRKRDDIGQALAQKGLLFHLLNLHLDALADLTLEGRVVVENGAYRAASVPAMIERNGA